MLGYSSIGNDYRRFCGYDQGRTRRLQKGFSGFFSTRLLPSRSRQKRRTPRKVGEMGSKKSLVCRYFCGAPGRTRTCDLLISSHTCSRTGGDREGQGETKPRFYKVLGAVVGTGRDRERHGVVVPLWYERGQTPYLSKTLRKAICATLASQSTTRLPSPERRRCLPNILRGRISRRPHRKRPEAQATQRRRVTRPGFSRSRPACRG